MCNISNKACISCCPLGGEWTLLSEEVTDNFYEVKDLPAGASYVFRVGCINKTGTGPLSDASAPVVIATHPEGRNQLKSFFSFEYCFKTITNSNCFLFFTEVHIPLVQAELKGSKVTGSKHQTTQRNYNFLSEINRWMFL